MAGPTTAQLRAWLAALGRGLLQRDEAVHLCLLAALAGEHVLLIGPPGTAKSALARRLHHAFADARYFERLLTRFSTPEELFGPLSLKALEHDRYERLTDGFLPTAGIAFLDEVFKANSAILNALLTLLNERLFDNGTQRHAVPLVAVIGASNEVPSDEALHAFYDRFLLRVPVAPLDDNAFASLLALREADAASPSAVAEAQPLTPAQRGAASAAAAQVALGEDFVAACTALRSWLAARKTPLTDRRWRQVVRLAQTAAATEGRAQLDALDLWLAPYVASAAPADVPALQTWFEDDLLVLPAPAAPWLERAVEAFEKQLGLEQRLPAAGHDALDQDAGKLALARALAPGAGAGHDDVAASAGMPRIVSERLEARLAKRWSTVHIGARVAQVEEIEAQVQGAQVRLAQARQELDATLAARLWVPATAAQRWCNRYDDSLALLAHLRARLDATRAGFAALPVDETLAEPAPAPVVLPAAECEPVEATTA